MLRLALHGPMYSGKTTLSRQLVSAHGFTLVNYTDYLKELAARALTYLGQWTSVEMMKADKAKYRGFLQHLGTLLRFDDGDKVEQCLFDQAGIYCGGSSFEMALPDRIVFDNVRTPAQLAILEKYGFTLVRLGITDQQQRERASNAGVSVEELANLAQHSCEQALPYQTGEVQVSSLWTPEQVAALIMERVAA